MSKTMRREDVFRQIPWSITHCFIALGVIVLFRAVFYLLIKMGRSDSVYVSGVVLWMFMFGWMAIFPVWIARGKGILQKPNVGLVLKELGIAIPLVLFILIVEWLIVLILSNIPGAQDEISPTLSWIRDAPNYKRLYLLLIAMITFGPVAEELLFRGLLYNALRQWVAPLIAVFIQAMVFALVHYRCPDTKITSLLFVFAMGVVLASVYEWRKTLWSPIALHVLKNFAFAAPIIILIILNSHTPAKTWIEAEKPPGWLGIDFEGIEKQTTGEEQRLYAINTWGSRGLRMWKKELRALQAVCEWFPRDREACAQARVGIVTIYLYYLRDFRRAVVESDRILSEFGDQPEACAQALLRRGWSYYELGDRQMSRKSFQEIIDSYSSFEWVREAALEELKVLDDR